MLNKIDAYILKELLQDGRKNFTKIAKKLKVSKKTIWKHYTLMKQKGVILGATTHIDYKKCAIPFSQYAGCSVCIKECTFFKGDFDNIKKIHFRRSTCGFNDK